MVKRTSDYNLKERKRKRVSIINSWDPEEEKKSITYILYLFFYFCYIINALFVVFHTTQCTGPTEDKMKRKEG